MKQAYNQGMVTVAESELPLTLIAPGLTDAQFQEFCQQYADYRLEYTAEGELIIMPPTDSETSSRNAEITFQLKDWARTSRLGIVTDSSGGFVLPNGARRSPDAAWGSRERFRRGRPPGLGGWRMCPEFVIELILPYDRLKEIRAKMLEWIANGAELGWMVNPRNKSVTIYRPRQDPEVRTGIDVVAGEGPVAGFVMDLRPIWNPMD